MNYKKSTLKIGALAGLVAVLGAGAALVPTYAAADDETTVINATIGSMISISTSSPVNFGITPSGSGSGSSASDVVSVTTNNSDGYYLQLEDADSNTDLVSGSDVIAATSGTFASPATMDANSWGFRVDGQGAFGVGPTTAQTSAASLSGTWAGVPASGSPVTIKTTSAVANNDQTTVWYGAYVDSVTPNGTYSDTVKYTATTN